MKGKTLIKIILPILVVILVFSALSILAAGQAETLPWRPTCQNGTFSAGGFSDWQESFDGRGLQTWCWYNDTVLYIQQDLLRNFQSQLFRRTFPNAYIEGLNYVLPVGPQNIGDINLSFEYYFPFFEDGTECPIDASNVNAVTGFHNVRQIVLVGENEANFSVGTNTFDDAFNEFHLEGVCGEWRTFSHLIDDFENDFGSSFAHSNRDLGIFGFEVANMYIRNVTLFHSTLGTQQIW